MEVSKWRDAVTVKRGGELTDALNDMGRATVFDFTGSGGAQTWLGVARLAPNGFTPPHHHGRHEVALYVVKGKTEIRWGERMEFSAQLAPGDFAYFAPFVPHQEINPDDGEAVEFVVIRSDNERIAMPLDA